MTEAAVVDEIAGAADLVMGVDRRAGRDRAGLGDEVFSPAAMMAPRSTGVPATSSAPAEDPVPLTGNPSGGPGRSSGQGAAVDPRQVPLTCAASSEARNAMALATVSGPRCSSRGGDPVDQLHVRPSGRRNSFWIGVRIDPGATLLQRTPCLPNSTARHWVSA